MAKTSGSYPTKSEILNRMQIQPHDRTHVVITPDPRTSIHNFVSLHRQFNLSAVVVAGFSWSKSMTHQQIRWMNQQYQNQDCVCVPILSTQLGFKTPAFYLIHAQIKNNDK
jgi:hypothetical protein